MIADVILALFLVVMIYNLLGFHIDRRFYKKYHTRLTSGK
jgi:hypothetical protein